MKELHFHYDLRQEMDPDFRAGIYGLYLACKFMRDPKFCHRYPDVPADVSWEFDEDKDTISIWGPELSIRKFVSHGWGHMRDGLIVPPGYTDEPNHPGIYATAIAHQTQTMVFLPPKKTKTRRAYSFADAKSQKIIPSGYSLKTTWGFLPKRDGTPLTINTKPWLPLDKAGEPVEPLSLNKLPSAHPKWQAWHFGFAGLPKDAEGQQEFKSRLLLLHCNQYAHLGVRHTNGITGLVPDAGSFKGFMEAFDRYRAAKDHEVPFLYSVGATVEVAALMMARFLELPKGRSYSYISHFYEGGASFGTGVLAYSKERKTLANAFLRACKAESVKGKVFVLRNAPLRILHSENGKINNAISIYDQVLRNTINHRPWFHGLGALSMLEPQQLRWMREPLTIIATMGDTMEKQIHAFVWNCVRNRANREWERKGRTPAQKKAMKNEWWGVLDEARAYIAKVYLRQISTKSRLQEALRRMTSETGTTLDYAVLEALEAYRPNEAADLMGLYCFTRYKKETPEAEAGAPPEDVEGDTPSSDKDQPADSKQE